MLMRITHWSPSDIKTIEDLWAKSPDHVNDNGESILSHTVAVSKRAKHLCNLKSDVIDTIVDKDGKEKFIDNIIRSALFHDIGKINLGFQKMIRTGSREDNIHHALVSIIPIMNSFPPRMERHRLYSFFVFVSRSSSSTLPIFFIGR